MANQEVTALLGGTAAPPRYQQVARQLAAWEQPAWLVQLGLAMRAVERGALPVDAVAAQLGADAADAAAALAELAGPPPRPTLRPLEPIWRLFTAIHRSPAAGLLKLTELLMQLRHTPAADLPVAPETIAAAAHASARLGMWTIRGELLDIATGLSDPHLAAQALRLIERSAAERAAFFDDLRHELRARFAEAGIEARIERRPRLVAEMVEDGLERTNAASPDRVNVLCGSVVDCYRALGVINSSYRSIGSHLRDHISDPKDNGYQAIRTVIEFSAPERLQQVKIHIATEEMLRFNRLGLLAWLTGEPAPLGRRLWWADRRRWLEAHRGESSEMFVFTPRGEPIYLPRGATVLDFAVRVHQHLGVYCRGALVNAHRVSPGEPLECGDLCEVLLDRHGEPIDQRLLDLAATRLAKSQVRRALQTGLDGATRGRQILRKVLDERLHTAGLHVGEQTVDQQLATLCRSRGYQSMDAFYRAVARGEAAPDQVVAAVMEQLLLPRLDTAAIPPEVLAHSGRMRLAQCCWPHPPRPAVATVASSGHVLRVHAADCAALGEAPRFPLRWRDAEARAFAAEVLYESWDRPGLIYHITGLIADLGDINIRELHADVPEPALARVRFSFEAPTREKLDQVRQRLERLPERRHVELRAIGLVDDGMRSTAPLDNPYGPQPVGRWPLFLGRDAEVAVVTAQLAQGSGVRHVLVRGPKRIGKSSLLEHLSRYHLNDFSVPALLNLQGLSTADLLFPRLITRFTAMIAQKAGVRAPQPDPGAADDPIAAFGAFLDEARARARERFVILVDELGVIAGRLPPDQAREFFDRWRALLNDQRIFQHLAFVVAMPDAALASVAGTPSQIGELGAVVRLGPLDEHDTRDLICAPVRGHLEYDCGVLDRLVAETGGHPYYVHLVCSQVVAALLARRRAAILSAPERLVASEAVVDEALTAVLANADVFQHVLADSSAETRAVLLALAAGTRDAAPELARARLLARLRRQDSALSPATVARALDDRPDLLYARDGAVGFRVALVARWLRRHL